MLRLQKTRHYREYDEDEWFSAYCDPVMEWAPLTPRTRSWAVPVSLQEYHDCEYQDLSAIQASSPLLSHDEWDAGPLHYYLITRGTVGEILQFAKSDVTDIGSVALRERFNSLVQQWTKETRLRSSMRKICSHPAYQEVIDLGEAVIPLIFEEMSMGELHWSWALSQITGINPAANTESPSAATDVWLQWIQDQGFVTSKSVRAPSYH